MIKSNLRWAGGKSRIIKHLDPFFPKEINKYLEVFVGGGSVLLYIIQKHNPCVVIANDIDRDLINYYKNVQTRSEKMVENVLSIKRSFDSISFKNAFKYLNPKSAEGFFIKNKTSFSGLNTSYSKGAYDKNFTEKSILNINNVSKVIKNVDFHNEDFADIHTYFVGFFIYLDPPYLSNKTKGLYGKKGRLHKEFDHEELFSFVEKLKYHNKIMISYDDNEYIRNLYKDYFIYSFKTFYSMTNVNNKKCKMGTEIIITNYKIEKEL